MTRSSPFQFASHISAADNLEEAIDEVVNQTKEKISQAPDLAIVFSTASWIADTPHFSKLIQEKTGASVVAGCTGESIVGTGVEVESQPALSLWLASLPDVSIQTTHIECKRIQENQFIFPGWPGDLSESWSTNNHVLLFADPFSFALDVFIDRFNEERHSIPLIGGVASGAHRPGEHRLFLNDQDITHGAVALSLDGPIKNHTLVSQGCRPVGESYVITQCHDNVIEEIGRQTASELLQKIFKSVPERDQELLQQGVFIGLAMNEYQQEFGRGDYLIRNILGVAPQTGALTITDQVRRGQRIQFHVRDQITADEDLKELLERQKKEGVEPEGGLLFTCNGRGTRLFSEPHHDASCFLKHYGDIPLAGFFCNGEIGPIQNQNFLHGFTASAVLFEYDG